MDMFICNTLLAFVTCLLVETNVRIVRRRGLTIERIHETIKELGLDPDHRKDAFLKALCHLTKKGYDFKHQHDDLSYLYSKYQQKYHDNHSCLFNYYNMRIAP